MFSTKGCINWKDLIYNEGSGLHNSTQRKIIKSKKERTHQDSGLQSRSVRKSRRRKEKMVRGTGAMERKRI